MSEQTTTPALIGDCTSLVAELARIEAQIERLPEDGKVSGGGPTYRFASIDAMSDVVRPMLGAAGLVMHPVQVRIVESTSYPRANGGLSWRTVLHVTWHVTDGLGVIAVVSVGEAIDTSDKSANKAQTAARKYALKGLFHLSTGENADPDAHRPGEDTCARQSAPAPGPGDNGAPAPDDPYRTLVDAYSDLGEQAVNDVLTALACKKKGEIRERDEEIRAMLDGRRADVQAAQSAPPPAAAPAPPPPHAPPPPDRNGFPVLIPPADDNREGSAVPQHRLLRDLVNRMEKWSPTGQWGMYVTQKMQELSGQVEPERLSMKQASALIAHLQAVLRMPDRPTSVPAAGGA